MRDRGAMSLFGTNSVMSIVRVDSRAMVSKSSLDTSMYVSVSTLYPFVMSSFETSSPVSASTFMYLMRWPVFRLIWLKLIFSESEVAGYRATGQVTSERRKKPFQLARGAMGYSDAQHSTSNDITAQTGFKCGPGIILLVGQAAWDRLGQDPDSAPALGSADGKSGGVAACVHER